MQKLETYIQNPLLIETAPTPTEEASTLDWDTVFAVSYDDINSAIKKNKGCRPQKLICPPSGYFQFSIDAVFDDWQVIPGGDGATVHLLLPMTNMKAHYVLKGHPGTVTCDAMTMTVAVKLNLLPHKGAAKDADGTPLPPPAKGTTRHALRLRTTGTTPQDPIASIVNVDYVKPLSDPSASSPIRTCLDNWVLTQIQTFEHIFAFVDLNDQIDHGDFAFTKPVTTSYAVCDTIDKTSGMLAVLSMTSTDPAPAIQQVSSQAIPDGATAAFLIRRKRFLVDMIKPGLLHMWPNLRDDMLELSRDARSLRMKDGVSIMLSAVQHNGDDYTPELLSFDCKVSGNELVVTTSTQVEVSTGIYGTCFSRTYYKLDVGKNKKGEQIITYSQSRKPSIQKGHWSKPGVEVAQTILTIIAAVLGIVLIFLTDGAAAIVVAALLFAMIGHFAITNLQDDALDAAPGLSEMVKHFTGAVIWTSRHMHITSSGLHGSLQLGGDFG